MTKGAGGSQAMCTAVQQRQRTAPSNSEACSNPVKPLETSNINWLQESAEALDNKHIVTVGCQGGLLRSPGNKEELLEAPTDKSSNSKGSFRSDQQHTKGSSNYQELLAIDKNVPAPDYARHLASRRCSSACQELLGIPGSCEFSRRFQ